MNIKPYERSAHYYETDQMGIIHHSNYIRWFEEARIDLMDQCGVSYAMLEQRGILIPVLSVNVNYIKPARFADPIRIEMKLSNFEGTHGIRFTVSYQVTHRESGQLLVTGESCHCFTDKGLRVVRLKRDHPDFYQAFLE
ncbi:acyl-CoA thioesterase, partial [Eubacteriales bacterium OttesenSCG-928-N13]|nr:acyl-CoA thioesterase [Eubacteriales bacterium OttesenSCG-928-N13]